MSARRNLSAVALAVYIACIPRANWFIQHVGRQDFPHGPAFGPTLNTPKLVRWLDNHEQAPPLDLVGDS